MDAGVDAWSRAKSRGEAKRKRGARAKSKFFKLCTLRIFGVKTEAAAREEFKFQKSLGVNRAKPRYNAWVASERRKEDRRKHGDRNLAMKRAEGKSAAEALSAGFSRVDGVASGKSVSVGSAAG